MEAASFNKYHKIAFIEDSPITVDEEIQLLGESSGMTQDMDDLGREKNCEECSVLKRKLETAEELLNHAYTLMSEKNSEIFSKKVHLWQNDKGMYF